MKKLILIICLVFLMTGCDVNYNITIDEDTLMRILFYHFLKVIQVMMIFHFI